jgi:hypothetical protein
MGSWIMKRIVVDDKTGCWNYIGRKDKNGYGIRGFKGIKGNVRVHRAMYYFSTMDDPAGRIVMHTCDNPSCVNPFHLVCGTPKDNSVDMARKGRQGQSKLTSEDVLEIRQARTNGELLRNLSDRFGVTKSTICHAARGITWTHLTGVKCPNVEAEK